MGFEENVQSFAERISGMKENITTEEATKTSIIMPFFQLLGYDVFNPMEFIPEYTADVGIKKGEKVDYAICLNGELVILVEAKSINETLQKHDSQLFRYFGTTKAKFAILTNGIIYRFYTDLDEQNKMDTTPFLEINLLDLNDVFVSELKKFQKENFDVSTILDTASELKYMVLIKKVLKNEFANPSDELVKFILNNDVYDGIKTQAIIDKYKPLVKKAISQYINDLVNDRIQNALSYEDSETEITEFIQSHEPSDGIVTTEEELQSYYIVKSILGNTIPIERITYKDTKSYFGVLIDGKVTKWICRVYIKENIKFVIINKNGIDERHEISSIDDIYSLSDELILRVQELCEAK